MTAEHQDPLTYYAQHGSFSNPGIHAPQMMNVSTKIEDLCKVVQGFLLHIHWAEKYGIPKKKIRQDETELRHVSRMLARGLEIDPRPIPSTRLPMKRLIGNCRHFSVLLTALLRQHGIPARARCGFARYFKSGYHEDHWICEYWSSKRQRWTLVDAQLDELQIAELKLSFDPINVPRDQFLVAGQAWQLCRHKHVNPETFGIFDMRGLWFVRDNLVRDVAALNKMPLLPWDAWGMIEKKDDELNEEELALLDRAAIASMWEIDYPILRTLYSENVHFRVPGIITTCQKDGCVKINVATEEIAP